MRFFRHGVPRAALLYMLLTLALAYPLTAKPGGSVLSVSPDTDYALWALQWDTHAFLHQPLAIFDANIYYPERHTLAYSENLIGSAFFAAPVLWLTHNPVLAMNIVALLSCALCGLGVYVLARSLGIDGRGATLAGMIFAFSPPRFLRLDQLHLTTIQWVPFGLAALHTYLKRGRRLHLRLAAGCLTLQALTSGHGAVFLIVAMAALIVYQVVLGEPIAIRKRLRDLGIPGALLLATPLLLVFPYRSVQVEMGLRRSLENWAIPWSSFFASPTYVQTMVLSLMPAAQINETAGAYLFPGYLPLVLAAAALLVSSTTGPAASPRRGIGWRRAALALELAALSCAFLGGLVAAQGSSG